MSGLDQREPSAATTKARPARLGTPPVAELAELAVRHRQAISGRPISPPAPAGPRLLNERQATPGREGHAPISGEWSERERTRFPA